MHRRLPGLGVIALLLLLAVACVEDPVTPAEKTPEPPGSPEAVVRALSYSYQTTDLGVFKSILAHDVGRNASYQFFLSEPTDLGETQWGYDEEVKIQRRMFRPDIHVTGEPPVPPDLWLSSVSINLTQLEPFGERTDLYSTSDPIGADGKLDPAIWKAVDARYGTNVFFDTHGDNDFQVTGEANFVVIEDKTKAAGKSGKFLLFIWEDMGSQPKPVAGVAAAANHPGSAL
jgi:hypothetical protein